MVSGTWEEGAGAAGGGACGLALTLKPVAPASTCASVCSLRWALVEAAGRTLATGMSKRVCVFGGEVLGPCLPGLFSSPKLAPARPARTHLFLPLLGQMAPPRGLPCCCPRVLHVCPLLCHSSVLCGTPASQLWETGMGQGFVSGLWSQGSERCCFPLCC